MIFHSILIKVELNYFTILVLLSALLNHDMRRVEGVSVEEDLTLSYKEKLALDKFRAKMKPLMPKDFMRSNFYLVRWLRVLNRACPATVHFVAQNFDQEAAERMLIENLRWRRENNIDKIKEMDWSFWEENYPYDADTFDKTGRPIGTINLGRWDVRSVALAGKMRECLKYMDSLSETAMQAVIKQQELGRNVTQYKILINLEGFNLVQHACPLCIPGYVAFVQSFEDHYPGFSDALILINTPPAFQVVLELIRPILSRSTRRGFKVLGMDKNVWQAVLDKDISRDQRRPEFGGTKKD